MPINIHLRGLNPEVNHSRIKEGDRLLSIEFRGREMNDMDLAVARQLYFLGITSNFPRLGTEINLGILRNPNELVASRKCKELMGDLIEGGIIRGYLRNALTHRDVISPHEKRIRKKRKAVG